MSNANPFCTLSAEGADPYRPRCGSVQARACSAQAVWIRQCSASISAQDPLILAADCLDLADTLWDRPSCQAACPRLSAELLFENRLTSLL